MASEECLTVLTSNWATKRLSEGILVNFLSAIKFPGEALEKLNKAVSLKRSGIMKLFPYRTVKNGLLRSRVHPEVLYQVLASELVKLIGQME